MPFIQPASYPCLSYLLNPDRVRITDGVIGETMQVLSLALAIGLGDIRFLSKSIGVLYRVCYMDRIFCLSI